MCNHVGKADERTRTMSLFTPDLYRNFGIGFGAGAVAVLIANGGAFLSAVPQVIASIF